MLRRLITLLKRALVPQESVTGLAVTGGIWSTLINVADRVLRLGMLAVLARYLDPADFGLMGIALLTLGAIQQFSNLGLDSALIQHRDENVDRYLNTAWVMQIGRGGLLAAIAFLGAPFVADFFNEARAADVLRVISIAPLLLGLRNPGVVYLQKNMEFHKRFIYQITGAVFNVTVAITFAYVYRNVWALVFGLLAERTAKVLVSYYLHDYRPWPAFDLELARGMYDAFLGWFLGATALGFYQMAYRFSNAPATEVTHIISQVTFPAYSKVQDDLSKLREGFFRTLQLTTVVSFPMATGIAVVAPTFVLAVFGTGWLPMVLPMQILAAYGASRSFGSTFGPLFQAIGRPDLSTKLQAANLAILAVLIYPLTAAYGTTGTALAVAGVMIITPVPVYLVLETIEASYRRFIRILFYPTAGSIVMGITVWFAQSQLELGSSILELLLLIGLGVVVYGLAILSAERWFGYGINSLLRTMKESIA
jgi:PST family polysaccharide transporter/lipopolysaccharide exporter